MPTRCLESTHFGAATSCVPRARGGSSPTPGFPMSRCPLPTRIRRRRACANRAAFPARPWIARRSEQYLREVDLPGAIAGIREEADELHGSAQALSDRPGGLSRGHVGPRDGGARQGRSGALCALRRSVDRQSRPSLPSRSKSATVLLNCWAVPATNRHNAAGLLDGRRCLAQGSRDPDGIGARSGRGGDRPFRQPEREEPVAVSAPGIARVPRANIDFLPIKDAWFSGSMNYIGRARNPTALRNTKQPTRSTPRCRFPSRSSNNS